MRLPLTGLSGCGLLRVFRAACRLSPIFCVCSFAVPLFFCIFFSAVFLFVFLFVACFCIVSFLCHFSRKPFSCVRHPGVVHTETRVSDVPRPGCQTCQDPGVMQCPSVSPCFLSAFRCSFPRACAYIIMYPFCQTFHPP